MHAYIHVHVRKNYIYVHVHEYIENHNSLVYMCICFCFCVDEEFATPPSSPPSETEDIAGSPPLAADHLSHPVDSTQLSTAIQNVAMTSATKNSQ